jgi:chitinase
MEQASTKAGTTAAAWYRTRRPAAPTGLTATITGGTVSLAWTATANATGYDVYRATSSTGTYQKLTTSPQPGTTYTDTTVLPGTTYWYEVRASNTVRSSSASAPVSATVPVAGQPVTVTLSPGKATLDGCATLQLTAAVTGAAGTGVTWSVQEGAAGGTVSSAGLYTAPSTAGTYHVVASSSASSSAAGTATVTIQDHILSVAVKPAAVSLNTGGTAQITATVTTTCGTFAAQ